MPVVLHTLSARDRDDLHRACMAVYLDGHCYEFAGGLNLVTGWPIVAVENEEHRFRHAGVRDPNGNFWDVRGNVMPHKIGKPFGSGPITLHDSSLEELRTVRPINDFEIDHAARRIELLWQGELPILPHNWRHRYHMFAQGLEALSQATGIYLRSSTPGQRPFLGFSDDIADGYELWPTELGGDIMIDRKLR